jgi:hypothetical protein
MVNNPLWQMLQQVKTAGANDRKRRRLEKERLAAGIPADVEDQELERLLDEARPVRNKHSTPRPSSGACVCCGEVTRGGSFLPGHDAKYKSMLRAKAKGGDQAAQQLLIDRGWAK